MTIRNRPPIAFPLRRPWIPPESSWRLVHELMELDPEGAALELSGRGYWPIEIAPGVVSWRRAPAL